MVKIPKNKTEKQQVGAIGEALACKFLEKKNLKVIERNYLKPYGEIDIIAKNGQEIIFVEVKTVTRVPLFRDSSKDGTRVTNGYRPEDNLHPWKLKRLIRAINSYLVEKKIAEGDWRFDVITVYLDSDAKKARIEHLEGIVL